MTLFLVFHRADPDEEWLFVAGSGISVVEGLGAVRATIWSRRGTIVATGVQQMSIVSPS
jgi:acyl-CoA thioesterase